MLNRNSVFLGDSLKLMENIDNNSIDMILCDLVLDNCAGSGTTGIACINLKRDYILMELIPEHYEIIIDRIDKHKNSLV